MDKIEQLVTLSEAIKDLWEELESVAPETTLKLKELLDSVPGMQEAAKRDLRTLGAGTHEFGDFQFQVKPGTTKKVFDIDDVLFEAEDNGQMEVLLDAGFLKYTVDDKQLARLPADIRAVYAGLATDKTSTPRVYLPKNLCK